MGGGATAFVALEALAKIGKSFWISFSSCSESALLSESSSMVALCGKGTVMEVVVGSGRRWRS